MALHASCCNPYRLCCPRCLSSVCMRTRLTTRRQASRLFNHLVVLNVIFVLNCWPKCCQQIQDHGVMLLGHLAHCRPVRFGGVSVAGAPHQIKVWECCAWWRGHYADKIVRQKETGEMIACVQDIIYVLWAQVHCNCDMFALVVNWATPNIRNSHMPDAMSIASCPPRAKAAPMDQCVHV